MLYCVICSTSICFSDLNQSSQILFIYLLIFWIEMSVFSWRDSTLLEHPLNMQDVNQRRWLTFCSVFKVTLHLLLLQASELTPLILSNLRSSEAETNPHLLLFPPLSPFIIQPFHYNCCLPPTAQLSLFFNSYNRDSHFKWRLWQFINSPAVLNTLIAVTLMDSKRSSWPFFFLRTRSCHRWRRLGPFFSEANAALI